MRSVAQSILSGPPGAEHAGDLFGCHCQTFEFRPICDLVPVERAFPASDCIGRRPHGIDAAKGCGGRLLASAAIPHGSIFHVVLPGATTVGGQ
jgi:hypothetical protein